MKIRCLGSQSNDITAEIGMPKLLTCLMEREFYQDYPQLPHRVIADHLALGLVCDFSNLTMHLDGATLSRWGLPAEQAFSIASDNLKKRSTTPLISRTSGVFGSPWQDDHDASRLADLETIRECIVNGDYVAAVPNCNTLMVTGSDDINGLTYLFDVVEATLRLPRPLCGIPVRLCENHWVPLELPPDHPQYDRLRLIRLRSEADECTSQKKRIWLNDKEYGKYYVASYILPENHKTGKLYSCSVWTDRIAILLPRTEFIAFLRMEFAGKQARFLACGEWEHVRSVVGDLMTSVGMYPERYRVKQFPSRKQLKAIGFDERMPRP